MQFGYSDTCLDHDTGERHPETADRLRAIRRRLEDRHGVRYVDAGEASWEAMAAVHEEPYLEDVREFCEEGGGNWDPDTVACEATWEAAATSAGLAEWAAREALDGADGRETPFAIGRPPGHHAEPDNAMGFCFINNAAVAAEAVIQDPDLDAERVAILDWDVHHGNGTQDAFYDREDVFYASIHEEGLFPGTGELHETGEGAGEGTTLNVPLDAGHDDADYLILLNRVIAPAIERFDPDLFVVSAGFDAHRHDPISRMRLSTEGYALMTDRVRDLCRDTDAALAFVLEGGYGLDTLSEGVATVHETFDGRDPMDDDTAADIDSLDSLVSRLRRQHSLE
jgi:acetoin utilization deacetylase AcuC-like enzyme